MTSSLVLLDPRNDLVFKLLFTRQPELLRAMLEAVLAQSIAQVTVLNPELPGDLSGEKTIALDIHVVLANGTRVDVEMQVRVTSELRSRLVYYAARDYAQQLSRGELFDALTPTVLVVWLDQPLKPGSRCFHRIFELRERATGELFSDQLTFHMLQLRDWNTGCDELSSVSELALRRWARFFDAKTMDQLATLALEDPVMAQAARSLEHLSQDPEAARLAREREDSIKLYRIGLAMSRHEGLAEGRQEGLAEGLSTGERRGLAHSIVQLCQAFGVAVTPEREVQLQGTVEELQRILNYVVRHREWP